MIELKITVTKENAERVIRLIKELVETEETTLTKTEETPYSSIPANDASNYLISPPELQSLKNGEIILSEAAEFVGSWGQFNSFFPVKAVLRVLSNILHQRSTDVINLQVLVDESIKAFKKGRLKKFRGFPKHYKKDSSIGRLVWHFITTANQIGLISIENNDGKIPNYGWDEVLLSITKEGNDFARLGNQVFDQGSKDQILTKAECDWLLKYLKKIDQSGFKEYTTLKGVYNQLQKGNTDIAGWFEANESFSRYIKGWSKKKDNPKAFARQLETLSATFAQSKIALLRELGLVQNKRNDYTIINPME